MPAPPRTPAHPRDPQPMLDATLAGFEHRAGPAGDLWIFAYGSLIWRPDFAYAEAVPGRIHGWHRALRMWSRVNRGTPDCPGLVFALLAGGSCRGVVFRVPRAEAVATLTALWPREMVNGVYDPRWLACETPQGTVPAIAFTLSRRSESHTGELTEAQYRQIFRDACGRFGSTRDYAQATLAELRRRGIRDRALERLSAILPPPPPTAATEDRPPCPAP